MMGIGKKKTKKPVVYGDATCYHYKHCYVLLPTTYYGVLSTHAMKLAPPVHSEPPAIHSCVSGTGVARKGETMARILVTHREAMSPLEIHRFKNGAKR